jgi:hypothetical protein
MPVFDRATRQSVIDAIARLNRFGAQPNGGEGTFQCRRESGRYLLERLVSVEFDGPTRLQWSRIASCATASAAVAFLDAYLDGYRAGCRDTDERRRPAPPVEPDADAADCCPVTGQEYGTGA